MSEQQTETLDQRRARLRDGRWHELEPRQTRALVTVGRFGQKALRNVWRGSVTRYDPVTGKFELDQLYDPHNHLKKIGAVKCAKKEARKRNLEEQ